jgi:hypothetical protein
VHDDIRRADAPRKSRERLGVAGPDSAWLDLQGGHRNAASGRRCGDDPAAAGRRRDQEPKMGWRFARESTADGDRAFVRWATAVERHAERAQRAPARCDAYPGRVAIEIETPPLPAVQRLEGSEAQCAGELRRLVRSR